MHKRIGLSEIVGLLTSTVVGLGLIALFGQSFLWRATGHQPGTHSTTLENVALIAVPCFETLGLGWVVWTAATRPPSMGRLIGVILTEVVVNLVLTVALFGIPVY